MSTTLEMLRAGLGIATGSGLLQVAENKDAILMIAQAMYADENGADANLTKLSGPKRRNWERRAESAVRALAKMLSKGGLGLT